VDFVFENLLIKTSQFILHGLGKENGKYFIGNYDWMIFFFLKAAGKQKIFKKVLTNSASW
jgi:hypothetical protein